MCLARHYVDPTPSRNRAFETIEEASNELTGGPGINEIWIAKGIYYPEISTLGDSCFYFGYRVTVYGGFDGTETNINQRDLNLYKTIMDGNIAGLTLNSSIDNCYHIINTGNNINLITFNGIIFQNGNANLNNTGGGDGKDTTQYGGVWYNYNNDDITISFINCTFRNNSANEGGAIWAAGDSKINIQNSIFFNNIATIGNYKGGYGGAIFVAVTHSVIINNTQFMYV